MDKPPFKKVLVANRGEIAVRIIRTLKDLSIKSVAVYSDADRRALHVLLADESYYIGSSTPSESYLNIERIIDVAKRSNAEAIHPGYGFLSQNPLFAERCEEEGIVFIGPGSDVQKLTGDKVAARNTAIDSGVPVVPGTREALTSEEEVLDFAEKIGYPVILKPALGGGGIGMKVCYSEEELLNNFRYSRKLAESAFGKSEIYLEKYFPKARHIEVQILADKHGNVIHLFERECSIQRRFQKVIEETPSPALSEDERKRVTELAVKMARAVKYVNAGTVEFIFDPDSRNFYFLEVNSRIQVEHPITEMVTGVNIVEEQLYIAAGYELRYSQNEILRRGCSIEARINAEDPYSNFTPSPGLIQEYREPSGFGVRVDSGVYAGYSVPPYYDPLIAKLIVWAGNRRKAIKRLMNALKEYVIGGIKTNIPLHLTVLNHPMFIKGDYGTRFLYEHNILSSIGKFDTLLLPKPHVKRREKKVQPVSAWKVVGRYLAMR
ncbi:MAG TPA: acetyl-CoA carboxylase biotin carboxylase subunit [Thermoprotei archaeon]|nr:acetyl-CoA carboxylase biotin carboxylase subunit [Thermoprotei archaeon]